MLVHDFHRAVRSCMAIMAGGRGGAGDETKTNGDVLFIYLVIDLRGLGHGARFGRVGATVESAGADAVGAVLAPQGFVPRDGPQVHQQPYPVRPAGPRAQHGRLPRGELVIRLSSSLGGRKGGREAGGETWERVVFNDQLHYHNCRAYKS